MEGPFTLLTCLIISQYLTGTPANGMEGIRAKHHTGIHWHHRDTDTHWHHRDTGTHWHHRDTGTHWHHRDTGTHWHHRDTGTHWHHRDTGTHWHRRTLPSLTNQCRLTKVCWCRAQVQPLQGGASSMSR
ncbi:uncharacterized protein LOC118410729 [Branchiostoma floridae]|uniref:Uncharacterized protein LOC118410729 n=1 Tax=Branchiostoma floridae TaxID=7739 RepID=A0A9J7MIU6_BRAFL|nr:uncharacterized protein LOC118410729 [Branchiostoma floridae]